MPALDQQNALLLFRVASVYCCVGTGSVSYLVQNSHSVHAKTVRINNKFTKIIDLNHCFGFPAKTTGQMEPIIVTALKNGYFGFWVDQILEVVQIPAKGWENLSSHFNNTPFRRSLMLHNLIYLDVDLETLSTGIRLATPIIKLLSQAPGNTANLKRLPSISNIARPDPQPALPQTTATSTATITSTGTGTTATNTSMSSTVTDKTQAIASDSMPKKTTAPTSPSPLPQPSRCRTQYRKPAATRQNAWIPGNLSIPSKTNKSVLPDWSGPGQSSPVDGADGTARHRRTEVLSTIWHNREMPTGLNPIQSNACARSSNSNSNAASTPSFWFPLLLLGSVLCFSAIFAVIWFKSREKPTTEASVRTLSARVLPVQIPENEKEHGEVSKDEKGYTITIHTHESLEQFSPPTKTLTAAPELLADSKGSTATETNGTHTTADLANNKHPPHQYPLMQKNRTFSTLEIEVTHPLAVSTEPKVSSQKTKIRMGTNRREFIHIVVKGDTLWDIARRYVRNPWLYPELAKLSRIKNPHLIYPGDQVRIVVIKQDRRMKHR
ncbi:MAG: LysM peptidoglycan-binding domain-containing protein [Gammaproteobacteria bacterium]|nr:LysM peptidoglycan-binding domain-containing protein [Gammaproteobacteria bacterium]MDH5801560.1 LysM peptidoglycan-binding domain-containing protein [Gammaproteobacteria bacterium]